MKLKAAVVTAAVLFALGAGLPASAGWFDAIKGNDTGGIVPWSPNLHETLGATASAHCANYNKIALVTSFPRQPGEYAGFVCAFPRDYDPIKQRGWGW